MSLEEVGAAAPEVPPATNLYGLLAATLGPILGILLTFCCITAMRVFLKRHERKHP